MIIDDKEYIVQLKDKKYHCAMDIAMSFIGGKWKTVILWYLRKEKKRFGELRKHCPQVTERMLSITLKQLEEDQVLEIHNLNDGQSRKKNPSHCYHQTNQV